MDRFIILLRRINNSLRDETKSHVLLSTILHVSSYVELSYISAYYFFFSGEDYGTCRITSQKYLQTI